MRTSAEHSTGGSANSRVDVCKEGLTDRTVELFHCDPSQRNIEIFSVSHASPKSNNVSDSSQRRFACAICHKRFTRSTHLRVHERVHNGSRPYACKLCDKTFAQSSNLRTHERIHAGYRPFACKLCDKRFIHSSHLRAHERCHTGERPFECDVCRKRFAHIKSLRNHYIMHLPQHSS